MYSEEEVNAVLDRLHRILLHRESARLYRETNTIVTESIRAIMGGVSMQQLEEHLQKGEIKSAE